MARLRLIALSVLILPLFMGCSGADTGVGNWARSMAGEKNKVHPTNYNNAYSWADSVSVWLEGPVYKALQSYCDLEKILVAENPAKFKEAGFQPYCSPTGPYAGDNDPPSPPGPPPGWGD